ncbi:MAG: hypothetical protein JXO22_15460 [Phycisphaerae bacterium]|nr:hypothetical protein [Phycisphaerae bacterium]
MRKTNWKRWALALMSGAVLLQVPTCTEVATIASGWANVLTAGSVIYLVYEIID